MGVVGEQPVNRGDNGWDWEFECIGDSSAGDINGGYGLCDGDTT